MAHLLAVGSTYFCLSGSKK